MHEIGERVLVIGCCGAGKTVFAQRLSMTTGLPLIQLDQHYWQPGWSEPDKDQWVAKVKELASSPRWIMDGNYLGTLPLRLDRADTVIFLDPPRLICLWRAMTRTLFNLGTTRGDMAPRCPERFDLKFFKYIWNFQRVQRPPVMRTLGGFKGMLMVLKSPTAANSYITAVERIRLG